MKRKILLLACIGILGAAAYGSDYANDYALERSSMNFKVGITDGEIEDQDTSANISLALEYIASTPSGFEAGLGIGFVKGELNEDMLLRMGVGDVDTYPIYALVRYKHDSGTDWDPYIFGNLGYGYTDEKFTISEDDTSAVFEADGGLYYALGIGAEYQENFSVELMWSRTEVDLEVDGAIDGIGFSGSGDIDADLITFALGYRLDM